MTSLQHKLQVSGFYKHSAIHKQMSENNDCYYMELPVTDSLSILNSWVLIFGIYSNQTMEEKSRSPQIAMTCMHMYSIIIYFW